MLEAGTFGDQFLAVSLFGQAEEQWQRWHGNFQLYLQLLGWSYKICKRIRGRQMNY